MAATCDVTQLIVTDGEAGTGCRIWGEECIILGKGVTGDS